jgi:outer membrane protein OmpA-like peptidoglycan-associated protein
MPPSSIALRSLAVALFGLGAVSAPAQSQSVTAFNPYNGVGLGGSAQPMASYPQAGPAVGGMAFNPWNPTTVAAGRYGAGGPAVVAGTGATVVPPSYVPYYDRGANLPPPPPGPIESRLLAVPEYIAPPASPRMASRAPAHITPPRTPPATAMNTAPPPAAVAPAPAPAPTAAPAPTPAPPPAPSVKTATVAPPPPAAEPPAQAQPAPPAPVPAVVIPPAARPEPPVAKAVPPPKPEPKAAPAPTVATLSFNSQSAEIGGAARSELERIAKSLTGARQIELRAYAGGPDPNDARKVALARALAVRSYLIDLGVKSRIEVGAFAGNGGGGSSERVDVIVPGT